jgi:hypothetical protein
MYSTLDIVTDIGIVLCGVAAIVYGFWRWRAYRDKKDLSWYAIGVLMLLSVGWDVVAKLLSLDHQTMLWSRSIVGIVIVTACIAIYYRFRLE